MPTRIARLASLVFSCALAVAVRPALRRHDRRRDASPWTSGSSMELPRRSSTATVRTRRRGEPLLGGAARIPTRRFPRCSRCRSPCSRSDAAGLVVMSVLVVVALAIPCVLGVRDWRCYGLAAPLAAGHLRDPDGNVTLWLALWLRARLEIPRPARSRSSLSIGVTLAVKFFLWPLVVWYRATRGRAPRGGRVRRRRCAAPRCFVGRDRLRRARATIPGFSAGSRTAVGEDSYTLYIAGLDLGLLVPGRAALWLAVGLGAPRSRGRFAGSAGRRALRRSWSRSPPRWRSARSSGSTTSRFSPSSWLSLNPVSADRLVRPARDGRHARAAVSRRRSRPAWTLAVAVATVAVALRAVRSPRVEPSARRAPLVDGRAA